MPCRNSFVRSSIGIRFLRLLGEQTWSELRVELARRLQLIGLHPPKRAMDIPVPFAQAYFDLMPIHEKLRAQDFPTTRNYLRVTMCNIHDEFSKRVDAPAVTDSLPRHVSRAGSRRPQRVVGQLDRGGTVASIA